MGGGFDRNTQEIRIRDASGAFRIIYAAKLADAVHVLHHFQKKTTKTCNDPVNFCSGVTLTRRH